MSDASHALPFSSLVSTWFRSAFPAPTDVQVRGWDAISRGEHTLMLAPTGSGKTLAAFLWSIDHLTRLPPDRRPGVRVLYISPLKALAYDIERNLTAPLVGVRRAAEGMGNAPPTVSVAVRTGDTPAEERRAFSRAPADIFITTPESLYLVMTSQARETLRTVETVIIDEIHVMAGSKRGAHLALTLERLAAFADRDPQRIGLSATQRPLETVAAYLGGDRPVTVVDASRAPALDLNVVVPVADMTRPWDGGDELPSGPILGMDADALSWDTPDELVQAPDDTKGMWPAIYPRILERIRAHRTSIVFVNSRIVCERIARRLNDMAGEELALAHHGSLAHEQRAIIEDRLKRGDIAAVVATSSMELGVDMGAVDLVIQVASPGSVARGLQRVGRAGHGVGQTSRADIVPRYRGDLLEATAAALGMAEGRIEATRLPRNPLDVLAQHIVAMVALEPWQVHDLAALVRRAAPWRELGDDSLHAVLDMLSGRWPSDAFAELRPRVTWDRVTGTLTARRGARMLSVLNAGTIPDRGQYSVHLGEGGPRIGELDEEMVHETRRGHTIILGASTWRVEDITRDRVMVTPAPGEPGRMPFWRGSGPGRPVELGQAVGELCRTLLEAGDEGALDWLREHTPLDDNAATNLVEHLLEQQAQSAVPTDRNIVIERFRDELGDWRICVLTPYGGRVHAPWALALEASLADDLLDGAQILWSDDGVILRVPDGDRVPEDVELLPDPETLDDALVDAVTGTAVFAAAFRESAARALLLPRRRPGRRTPLWAQRQRASSLLAAVRSFPDFPIALEAARECLDDRFDVGALRELLRDVRSRRVRLTSVETRSASPFARSLAMSFVAAHLYDDDMPLAERRAFALSLDRNLLRELLGRESLRELLDADAVDEVERALQRLEPDLAARSADALHDLVRRLGSLTPAGVAARCEGDHASWTRELLDARRLVPVHIAGEPRLVAVEDAAVWRDALGVALPSGIPAVFLEAAADPLTALVRRYARTHGPFGAGGVAAWLGLQPAQLGAVLRELERAGELVSGEMRPGGEGQEWCDESVLRRIRRVTLARLRREIAAVAPQEFAAFVLRWHGVGGTPTLEDALEPLMGVPIPWSALVSDVLPARVPGFDASALDDLGARGELAWIGAGALGPRDGRVVLVRHDDAPFLLAPPAVDEELSPAHQVVLDILRQRGACFHEALLREATARADGHDLQAALWDLVWLGLVTNDTFAPLRGLDAPVRTTRRQSSRRGLGRLPRAQRAAPAGRWSLVESLFAAPPPPHEAADARALALVERWGVASRAAARTDGLPGGFGGVYPSLRDLEETGAVRRGWFVDGLEGAQFAAPGAVDALREPATETTLVLSAVDPAVVWGAVLPWPDGAEASRPRRVAGAHVVLHGGELVLWAAPGRRGLIVFHDDAERVASAARAWAASPSVRGGRGALRTIGTEPAGRSRWTARLEREGFVRDGDQLRLPVR